MNDKIRGTSPPLNMSADQTEESSKANEHSILYRQKQTPKNQINRRNNTTIIDEQTPISHSIVNI